MFKLDNKTKQIIGIGVGTIGISVVSVLGFWYYKKAKEQAKIDKMMEEGEKDIAENYQNERPMLKKLKDAVVNKIYPQDYNRTQKELERDLEEFERIHARRARFTVFDSVQSRFKILETHGDKGVEVRGEKRFRVSGCGRTLAGTDL